MAILYLSIVGIGFFLIGVYVATRIHTESARWLNRTWMNSATLPEVEQLIKTYVSIWERMKAGINNTNMIKNSMRLIQNRVNNLIDKKIYLRDIERGW